MITKPDYKLIKKRKELIRLMKKSPRWIEDFDVNELKWGLAMKGEHSIGMLEIILREEYLELQFCFDATEVDIDWACEQSDRLAHGILPERRFDESYLASVGLYIAHFSLELKVLTVDEVLFRLSELERRVKGNLLAREDKHVH